MRVGGPELLVWLEVWTGWKGCPAARLGPASGREIRVGEVPGRGQEQVQGLDVERGVGHQGE